MQPAQSCAPTDRGAHRRDGARKGQSGNPEQKAGGDFAPGSALVQSWTVGPVLVGPGHSVTRVAPARRGLGRREEAWGNPRRLSYPREAWGGPHAS
ncbi:hypothetical protein E2562_001485 [Oryza meyeriana var. granulata]|uniref:Uncharacterized protein n=1 Tax=Oryza meyeriana var. granulata TaxID=110450 RepID=A0A6G1DD21_9ORYZ|nr:hypothetical protein E2562_001485 [Oryza meyeriana var. granulata]